MSNQNLENVEKITKESGKRNKWTPEIIIEKSRELFYEKGFDLSMRDIARELNTRASSLYRHIDNKRELWFAITETDFLLFSDAMRSIAIKHRGSSIELLRKIGMFFIKFSRENFKRFSLMFLYEPPKIPDKEKGKYELACNPDSISYLVYLCGEIIKEENLLSVTSVDLAIHAWSHILGYSVIKSPINAYLQDKDQFHHLASESNDEKFIDQFISFILSFKKQK